MDIDLHIRLRKRAIDEGISLSQLLDNLGREYLNKVNSNTEVTKKAVN